MDDNPVRFRNRETDALREASKEFFAMIEEYASANNLSDEEIASMKKLVLQVYTDKLASYYLTHKVSKFTKYINFSCNQILTPWQETAKKDEDEYDYLYLKSTKELLMNEQY